MGAAVTASKTVSCPSAWTNSSQWLAVGLANGSAELRKVDGGGSPRKLAGHREAIYALAFSPDGKRLATASDDGTALVW